MSQYCYQTTLADDGDVDVLMGYDRPLNYVFCVVQGVADEPLYSNLFDDNAGIHQQNIEYYRGILAALDLVVPELMYEQVKQDQKNQQDNSSTHERVCSPAG